MLDQKFHINNRKKLRNLLLGKADIIAVAGNSPMQRSGDTNFPFRQDSNFYYLTGVDEPNGLLIIDVSTGEEYLLFANRDRHIVTFEGDINTDDITHTSGISKVKKSKDLSSVIRDWKKLKVYFPTSDRSNVRTINFGPQYIEDALSEESIEVKNLHPYLAELRRIKQSEEIDIIYQAICITNQTLSKIMMNPSQFKTESEIATFITSEFSAAGVDFAYEPIIASGINACTLHYVKNSSTLSENNFLLMDVGAEVKYYAADITRTIIIGEATNEQIDIYNVVEKAHKETIKLIKPGVMLADLHKATTEYLHDGLRQLGILKRSEKERIHEFFPHSVTHYLGLDVHDMGDYKRELQEGVVLTIEPGLYIPEKEIGIRIEDNILVTKDGHRNLSEKLPTSLVE